jgi:type VI secretion system protein ImpA
VSEEALSAVLEDTGTPATAVPAAEPASSETSEPDAAGDTPPLLHAPVDPINKGIGGPTVVVATVGALCIPLSEADPCGPDLDLAGDTDYLNFFAQAEGILPSSFFSSADGRPFDRSSVDLPAQMQAIPPLWNRSRDLRLLVMRARLSILDRDIGGFAVSIAAIAHWLEMFWDDVHPRAAGGDLSTRASALWALDLPTVVFPLQYAPLFERRRVGVATYRAWMIATDEVKPRPGEHKYSSAALTESIADAPSEDLAAVRGHVAMLRTSLSRIRNVCLTRGWPFGLDNLIALADKLHAFIDPRAAREEESVTQPVEDDDAPSAAKDADARMAATVAPTSLAEAQQALAAIVAYYIRCEPSSPALPLIRQAHQLIGKSFFEVMGILLPTQLDKAFFQIGADQVFELPIGKLAKLAEPAPPPDAAGLSGSGTAPDSGAAQPYRIDSRSQAITLLEQIQRFFRHAEPSSPVPMLCERARALAERDFMSVLREVLPKAALKASGTDK